MFVRRVSLYRVLVWQGRVYLSSRFHKDEVTLPGEDFHFGPEYLLPPVAHDFHRADNALRAPGKQDTSLPFGEVRGVRAGAWANIHRNLARQFAPVLGNDLPGPLLCPPTTGKSGETHTCNGKNYS